MGFISLFRVVSGHEHAQFPKQDDIDEGVLHSIFVERLLRGQVDHRGILQ